jgi:ABC-type nitrate/sulfonate/bicarbonate transport system substrate-binding protein
LGIIVLTTASGKAQSKKPLVRMNYSGSIYATTPVVGVEKGFFDQQGLIMNATPESAGEIAKPALFGGSTDCAVASPARLETIAARKLPIKAGALS